MNLNQPVLDLHRLYSERTHVETMEILNELMEIRDELENNILVLKAIEEDVEVTYELEKAMVELKMLNINITTVEAAILCHESKNFYRRTYFGEIVSFGLN